MAGFFARLAIALVALLAASIACMAAVVFLCYALYLFLATLATPPLAALAAAGVALLFGICIAMAGAMLARKRRRNRPKVKIGEDEWETAANLGAMLGNELRGLAGEHGREALVASLVGGFMVGASPKLRAFLRGLFNK